MSVCPDLALVIRLQSSHFLRSVRLSCVACVAERYFSTLSKKGKIFIKESVVYKMCFDFLHNFLPKYFSFKEVFINIHRCSCKVPVILVSDLSET